MEESDPAAAVSPHALNHRNHNRTLILLPGHAARRGPLDLPGRKQVHGHRDAVLWISGSVGTGSHRRVRSRTRRESRAADSSCLQNRRHRRLSPGGRWMWSRLLILLLPDWEWAGRGWGLDGWDETWSETSTDKKVKKSCEVKKVHRYLHVCLFRLCC